MPDLTILIPSEQVAAHLRGRWSGTMPGAPALAAELGSIPKLRGLVALGHQRIVMLERAAIEEMAQHGLPTGPYNLPDWEDRPEGLRQVLDELFQVTAPAAMIIDVAFRFHASASEVIRAGIRLLQDQQTKMAVLRAACHIRDG